MIEASVNEFPTLVCYCKSNIGCFYSIFCLSNLNLFGWWSISRYSTRNFQSLVDKKHHCLIELPNQICKFQIKQRFIKHQSNPQFISPLLDKISKKYGIYKWFVVYIPTNIPTCVVKSHFFWWKKNNIYHPYFSVSIICVWPCPPPKLRNRTFQFDVHQAIMLLAKWEIKKHMVVVF